MRIVVKCPCTKTYRLPPRYAGKACRCKVCGERLVVPAEPAEGRKPAQARRTTRRLGAQDGEILRERRRLRESGRRPITESIHQLAPLPLSEDRVEVLAPSPRSRRAEQARGKPRPDARERKADAKREAGKRKADAKREAGKREAGKRETGKRETSKRETGKRETGKRETGKREAGKRETGKREAGKRETGKREIGKRKADAKRETGKRKADAKRETGKRETGKRKAAAPETDKRGTGKREAAKDARGKGRSGERAAPPARRPKPIVLLAAAAGLLVLGVGLGVGGLLASSGKHAELSAAVSGKLERAEACAKARQWEEAHGLLEAAATELAAQGGDAELEAKLRAARAPVEVMRQLLAIEDDEARVATAIDQVGHREPLVRLGVANELARFAGLDDAQRALAALAQDADPRVAEAARLALIEAGGPHALPYLLRAIEDAAATGHKIGDVALERALELSEPEVVPVLVRALELRRAAPAPVLVAILRRLAELGDPAAAPVAKTFADHQDEAVRAAAARAAEL